LQFQKKGKLFFWQKFDMQNQFHLSPESSIAQVCGDVLISIKKQGVTIQIKKELLRFEDPFYEFQTVDFPGIPITTRCFSAH
jgi:hypothetical protein